jgi:acetyl esterase/lipase
LGRAFAEREYAAILADYRYPNEPFQDQMTQDAFCALAWVQAYAGTYGMDVERIAVLGDDLGAAIAAKLVTVDDPGPFLESCPHPLSGPEGLKGIVTYGGDFLLPGPSLETGQRLMRIAEAYGLLTRVSYKELEGIFEVLRDLPAQDWRDNTELDHEAQEIARLLPLYWVTDSKHPTLLIDSAQDLLILEGGFRAQGAPVPPSQSDAYASELEAAGAQVDVLVLPDIAQDSVRGGESFAVVFEAIEAFTSQVLQ